MTSDGLATALATALLASLPAGPASAQAADTLSASAALHAFDANCDALGRALWGGSLCGPVVLVHPPTRAALASRPDPARSFAPMAGVYAGRLPDGLPIANTAVEWGGERWTMVLLPLPSDPRARYALVAHEAFHRAQPALGFTATDPPNPHLDDEAGRTWLRLELRALARALESAGAEAGDAGRAAARDALLFRAHRHRLYQGADTLEAALERHEGLAEYTGARFAALMMGDDVAWTARATRSFEARPSYVRSFAYATGPALGLLLDRYDPSWRDRARGRPLATLLAQAVAGDPVPAPAEAELLERAAVYDHATVAAEEAERAARMAARLEDIRRRFLDGSALVLTQTDLMGTFNPNEVVPVPDAGTYYPTASFRAAWGRVEVRDGGILVSPDWSTIRLPADALRDEGTVVHGAGWTLALADGWTLSPRDGGWAAVRQEASAQTGPEVGASRLARRTRSTTAMARK